MNNIKSFSIIYSVVLMIIFAGCSSVPIPKVTKYSLDTPVSENTTIKKINVSLRRVTGRTQYDKRTISISPAPHVMDSYTTAQWMESPCNMLTDDTIAYLSKKFAYVTLYPDNFNKHTSYTVTIFIDELNHVKRDDKWYAVLKLKYEIKSGKEKEIVINNRFEKKIELSDSSVQSYVNAQNKSVGKFLHQLTSELTKID